MKVTNYNIFFLKTQVPGDKYSVGIGRETLIHGKELKNPETDSWNYESVI